MSTAFLNPASASAILSALVCVMAAACVWPLGEVPDWEDLRPLRAVALTAAMVAACNVTTTLVLADPVYVWTSRLQVTAMAFHALAWHLYLPRWTKRPFERWHRLALLPLAAVALAALWPGAMFGDRVALRPIAWMGVVYHDPLVAAPGLVIFGVIGWYGLWAMVLMRRWGRAGAPYPRAHLACAGTILAMGFHDAAAVQGLSLPTPYLLDFAFYLPITLFGLVTLRRVSENASEFYRLRSALETAVLDRSRALEESQGALARAERLATMGRFSAGVAQEVSEPARGAAASVEALRRGLGPGAHPQAVRRLEEASAALERLVGLAEQLRLAGSAVGSRGKAPAPVPLQRPLEEALSAVRARTPEQVVVRLAVAPGLVVLADEELVQHTLRAVLANAIRAIPAVRSGTVLVEAEAAGDVVRVRISDDGVGMSEEELASVFEPFFGQKPPGMGSGLDLAVAAALVSAVRGTLRFESAVGKGTRAFLELPAARAGSSDAVEPPPPTQARLLVVDDDPEVLRSMARVLGRQHNVRVATGVREGLAAIEEEVPDLILCDVMMPAGGGERFWAELLLRAPALASRVVFMSGGALTPEAAGFVRRQPGRVLTKPFEVSDVNALLEGRHLSAPVSSETTGSRSAPLGRLRAR
jgi:signal transduction histidine kinase/CheY-like chemotaxis protein